MLVSLCTMSAHVSEIEGRAFLASDVGVPFWGHHNSAHVSWFMFVLAHLLAYCGQKHASARSIH